MKKRLLTLVTALAIGLLSFVASPQTASAYWSGSACSSNNGNYHLVVWHTSEDVGGARFLMARGTATVRNLGVCSQNSNVGLNAVLPANLQVDSTSRIVQLGYVYDGANVDRVKFVYVYSDMVLRLWPGDWVPVLGRTYTFTIDQRIVGAVYYTYYTIYDRTLGTTQYIRIQGWIGAVDRVWYGYEQQNTASFIGVEDGASPVNLTDVGYKTTSSGSTTIFPDIYDMFLGGPAYRQTWTFNGRERCSLRTGSGSAQYLNAYTYASGTDCQSI